ncbi:MAG: pilus assembly protein TadC, partial [Clostridiales bacterium]|nr:pilus assembly protein TadC [Clostridiales bacterium]
MFNTTLLSLVIVLFVVLLIISKKQYKDENSKLNEKEYPLKQILGVGMYLLDKLKYEYSTSLDREIL